MKKLVLTFTLLFIVAIAYSQKVLFSQDFDGFSSYSITGWKSYFSGSAPFQVGLPYQVAASLGGPMLVSYGTNKVAGVDGRYGNDSAYIYSPVINFSGTSSVYLSFDSYFLKDNIGTNPEKAMVEMSPDSGRTWNILQSLPADTVPAMTSYYLDISAYSNLSNVRLGFRYEQGSGGSGWAIDNVKMFVPAHKDMAMVPLYTDSLLNYVALNQVYYHKARVQNYGLDTVHAFVVKYRQDNGPVWSDTISGVTLPSFKTYDFTYSIPDTVFTAGAHKVNMWVELVGDTIHTNDTAFVMLKGAYFMPKKRLMIEEGTGTHYYWGPRGWVYMNTVNSGLDLDACLASIHAGDPMEVPDYNSFMYNCNYYAEDFVLDRKLNVGYDTFFATIDKWKKHFGYADLDVDGSLNGTALNVNVHVRPAIDLNGDYRLVLVVTEDHVTGTTPAYNQYNNFSGGKYGPMGGFENKSNPVPAADMYYNFVAREILPSPQGNPGMLPTTMQHNVTYSYSFNNLIDPSWDVSKLRAIVMLINKGDSAVLNSNKLSSYLSAGGPSVAQAEPIIYPNPAKSMATAQFYVSSGEDVNLFVADLTGRVVFVNKVKAAAGRNEVSIPVGQLSAGIYLVNLSGNTFRKTLKLEVLK